MTSPLPVPSRDTAPEASRPIFDALKQKFGSVPNLFATYGHSPNALAGLLAASAELDKGQFGLAEREIIYLINSEVNACHYCISAHSFIAEKLAKESPDVLLKLRKAQPTGNAKYDALANLTRAIGLRKGHGVEAEVKAFFDAGYNQAALVEVALIIGLNSANNYLNHLAGTPIDFPLAPELPPQHS